MMVFLVVLAISVLVVLPAYGLWRIRRREELERWYQNTRYIGYEHHVVQQDKKERQEMALHVSSISHSGNDPPSYWPSHSGTHTDSTTSSDWGGGESGGAGAGSDYGGDSSGGDSGSSDGGGGDGGGGGGD